MDYAYFEAPATPADSATVFVCGPGRKRGQKGIRRSPGSLWEALWQAPLGKLTLASPRVSGPVGKLGAFGLDTKVRLPGSCERRADGGDYISGSCRLLEFLLHSFRDIPSSLASASDGNRRGHARCHARRAQM